MVYFYGHTLRKRSPFAQQLSDARDDKHDAGKDEEMQRVPYAPDSSGYTGNRERQWNRARQRSFQSQRVNQHMGSRRGTPRGTPGATPAGSRANSFVESKKTEL